MATEHRQAMADRHTRKSAHTQHRHELARLYSIALAEVWSGKRGAEAEASTEERMHRCRVGCCMSLIRARLTDRHVCSACWLREQDAPATGTASSNEAGRPAQRLAANRPQRAWRLSIVGANAARGVANAPSITLLLAPALRSSCPVGLHCDESQERSASDQSSDR